MSEAQENLKKLCGAVLSGRYDYARALSLQFLVTEA